MERERTPTEARAGVVSGRVLLVLVTSFIAACAVLFLSWLLLFSKG